MKRIVVKFDNYPKEYTYITELPVRKGMNCYIAAGTKTYETPVEILKIQNAAENDIWKYKEITKLNERQGPPRGESPIRKVQFNLDKSITTVQWTDGTITTVRCDAREEFFDYEKAIALAFMKKAYGNRGWFNDDLRKWVPQIEDEEDNEQYYLADEGTYSMKRPFVNTDDYWNGTYPYSEV